MAVFTRQLECEPKLEECNKRAEQARLQVRTAGRVAVSLLLSSSPFTRACFPHHHSPPPDPEVLGDRGQVGGCRCPRAHPTVIFCNIFAGKLAAANARRGMDQKHEDDARAKVGVDV